MIAVNYTNLRENMKEYFDRVEEDSETMIVTRKDENMIVMSQSMYDNLMENLHLTSDAENYQHLMKSIEQYRKGKKKVHDLLEVEDE